MNNPTDKTTAASFAASSSGEYLSFRLGAEEYGIEILKVQEIRGFESPTKMVTAPAYVLGVLNLRLKFNMSDVVYNSQTVTIVLSLANQVVGMVVDAVSDVVALKGEDIKPAPDFCGAIDNQNVIGIATTEQDQHQRMLILMDIEKVMGSASRGLAQHDFAIT